MGIDEESCNKILEMFNKSIEEAEKILETNIQNGLTENDVKTKREKYGLNMTVFILQN